ncbi:hypothetical protein NMY22_g3631 [Coprinellus aureogranulatus]|nr:hypothetical protein NMY22_g3631 [Coprinellus aureogranulatus]
MLTRCGHLTLDIGWEEHIDRHADAKSNVQRSRLWEAVAYELQQRHRLRFYSLDLNPTGRIDCESLSRAWTSSGTLAPGPPTALEELVLCDDAAPLGYLMLIGFGSFDKRILTWLFGDGWSLPRLRALRVKNVKVDLELLSCPALEHLDIEASYAPEGICGPRSFLSISNRATKLLPGYPRIRRLRLHLQSAVKDADFAGEISLPELTDLDVATDYISLCVFLDHVSTPKCHEINVMFWESVGTELRLEDLPEVEMAEGITSRIIKGVVMKADNQEGCGDYKIVLSYCDTSRVTYTLSPKRRANLGEAVLLFTTSP